ncbi:MAG TPA: hypothetical protein VGC20_17355 [bacterium]|jgi:hypothetical protein
MANDKKVISLDERRRGQQRTRPSRPRAAGTAGADPAQGSAPAEGAAPDAAPGPPSSDPVPGRLIWLYCPTCRSIEYTELDMAGGRTHTVCGTQVQEAAVELDLRAETTIARINLERLHILEQLLGGQRQRYEEYLRRLNLAAGRNLEPYAVTDDGTAGLPVADVDAFGLLVSRFFDNPAGHFPDLAREAAPDAPPSGAGDD